MFWNYPFDVISDGVGKLFDKSFVMTSYRLSKLSSFVIVQIVSTYVVLFFYLPFSKKSQGFFELMYLPTYFQD